MYRAYNINVENKPWMNDETYHEIGKNLYRKQEEGMVRKLNEYLSEGVDLDANKIMEDWFKLEKADVFISHSHRDQEEVIAFAGWLKKEFGLKGFIDSCVWGNCAKMLKALDEKYALNKEKETYSYDTRNEITSHVHMMLWNSIVRMMYQTECLMFYNTPYSINVGFDDDSKEKKTYSTWIYSELSVISMLKRKEPIRNKAVRLSEESVWDRIGTKIEYDVREQIKSLYEVNDNVLDEWIKQKKSMKWNNSLDLLYSIEGDNYEQKD